MFATDSLHPAPDSLPQKSAELRALVDRARRGDLDALPRLRELLDERPEFWRQFGDLARHAEAAWIQLAGGTDLALIEALRRKVAELKNDLAGLEPSPLEKLLVERVAICWLQMAYSDAAAAQATDVSVQHAAYLLRRQDSTHRRYLNAIGALATLRKLLPNPSSTAPVSRIEAGQGPPVDRANAGTEEETRGQSPVIQFPSAEVPEPARKPNASRKRRRASTH